MNQKKAIWIISGILLFAWVADVPADSKIRPNIIVILTDDQGYADLGCQGSQIMRTPNIDSLAVNGVRFTNGYSSAPQCGPSRAGLLTGQYQQRFAMEQNAAELESFGLPLNIKLFSEYMKDAGYVTAGLGKWHIGDKAEKYFPKNRGFDWTWCQPGSSFELNGQKYSSERYTETSTHRTDLITIGACDFIRKNTSNPFFMYVAYHAPHSPYRSVPKWMDGNKHIQDKDKQILAGMISELDDGVGRILATLRECNLEGNTLIFYSSDNGAPESSQYPATKGSNDPLRGVKGNLYDGGMRVPWLVQWKGTIPGGRVLSEPVSSLDILPTSLAAAERPDLITPELDGVNLLPFLKGERPLMDRSLFFRWDGWLSMRQGRWKIVYPAVSRRDGAPYDSSKLELYDMEDGTEQTNLAQAYPEIVQRMEKEMLRWNDRLTAPGWISDERKQQLMNIYGDKGMKPYAAPGYTGKLPDEAGKNERRNGDQPPPARRKAQAAAPSGNSLLSRRDSNGDGVLNFDEFVVNPEGRNLEALRRQFEKKDINKDGYLDSKELE